jgi:hypothetical protein
LKKVAWKYVFEGIGVIAIVASLILVAMELRQNTNVAQANALFQLSAALDDSYRRRAQDPELAQLIKDGHDDLNANSSLLGFEPISIIWKPSGLTTISV